MGAQHKRKMQSTVLLVSLAVIFANASPISDSVVPEDTDFAMDTDLSEARATIDDMIADGASDPDCRKLTGDTINDIKSSVEILQKEIDAVSSGVECNTEGQTQVKITAEAQTKAHTTLTTATKELTKTKEHKVDFGSRVYSTLTVGKCDTFFSHSSYVTAKASFKTATKAFEHATGASARRRRSTRQCTVSGMLPPQPISRPGLRPTRSSVCSTTRRPAGSQQSPL